MSVLEPKRYHQTPSVYSTQIHELIQAPRSLFASESVVVISIGEISLVLLVKTQALISFGLASAGGHLRTLGFGYSITSGCRAWSWFSNTGVLERNIEPWAL